MATGPTALSRGESVASSLAARFRRWFLKTGAIVTTAFFDSSAFVKLLVDEMGSDVAATLWNDADVVLASRLADVEVSAALARAKRVGRIDGTEERRLRRDWREYWVATDVIELTPAIAAAAGELAARLAVAGADAVHLASALAFVEVTPLIATWDRRLWHAALANGLAVVPATEP